MSRRPTVAVVGGGVIGRTCALELASAGHAVTLLTADPAESTTSAKAAALVMPYAAWPPDRVDAWTARTMERFAPVAEDPSSGVRLVEGVEIHRGEHAEDVTSTLPLVDMSRYLPWLRRQGAERGVRELLRRVASVDEAREHGELVVLATGLETNALVPDAGLYPIQGQVVRVAHPGHEVPWLIDHEHPEGLLYVIPRIDEVVVGGTEVVGAWDLEADPDVEAAILARAAEAMPWIATARVTSRAVGLRPGRAEVRLERAGDVIHCYGHGGSGVTISWGCAEEVAALAAG